MIGVCFAFQVVELLLDRSNLSNIYEALLQAISAGHEQIAESILKHPKYQGMKKEHKHFGETDHFFNTASEDSPFSSDITPLILAAERNQFEIVQLLLLRGETIRKPHHYYCNCQECSNKLEYDQLRLAKTRLNAYKGLSSGAYISLSSKDPILTAFELARELRAVAKVEKYYKVTKVFITSIINNLSRDHVTCDSQQFDILTSVDSDEPLQPPVKLRQWCSVSSLTIIEYSSD